MDNSDVVLPGAGGHINGTNSARMGRKKREALTLGFPFEECSGSEAMDMIFGIKKYSQEVYRTYKEKEYSSIAPKKKGCGGSCSCDECKARRDA
ncbi:hypothetical protein SCBWM1_gp111 [Synechococcus phage S-CBWM1]|uniref:Uncharacterized protein n=1 Tax=Synechococcus phage S-CBWM1 TaxID=2053653 RepID=A0A3G1L3N3_9CAUD|nr:hypothetical protein HOU61_gp086 [Synechococcus phage S-CBWM1]ATW62795.1 hypothetical protein SCBWM1_gp111 [Synechococcus phage S-CBWM1]